MLAVDPTKNPKYRKMKIQKYTVNYDNAKSEMKTNRFRFLMNHRHKYDSHPSFQSKRLVCDGLAL